MEFAAEDAANGTTLRSSSQFQAAIEAMTPLGLQ
jgi:hypothetical protein